MGNIPFLLKVLVNEAKERNFLLKSLVFSTVYFILALFLFNYKAFESTFQQTFAFWLKIKISLQLFTETLRVIGPSETLFLLIASILFGLNLELLLRKLKFLKKRGSLHLTFGAGILSLVAAGCAGCGLSIASVIGIAGVVALLPFQGTELFVVSIIILLFSLWYNLKTLVRVCKIEPKIKPNQ